MQFRRGTTTHLLGVILGTGMVLTIVSPWIVLSRLDLQQQQQLSPSHWIQNRIQSVSHHNKENFPSLDGYSCHDIFGIHQLVRQGNCLQHQLLQWKACELYGPVFINVSRIEGSRGGEPVDQVVIGRSEEEEQLRFPRGSLLVSNTSSFLPPGFLDTVDVHMKRFLQSAVAVPPVEAFPFVRADSPSSANGLTLIVRRGNYANPCMALLTMYNVYTVLEYYCKNHTRTPSPTLILWLDGHARGDLDPVWHQLFGTQPRHIKDLGADHDEHAQNSVVDTTSTMADIVALSTHVIAVNTMSAVGDEGLGLYNWKTTNDGGIDCLTNSTLLHFRDFVLERYHLQRSTSPSHMVTMLVRQDYRAHPRSSGLTDRTLANVTADTAHVQSMYPHHSVRVVSFEGMPFRQQLEYMVSTDIFVTVHGAGNIHVLFLPDHATLVEYVPKPFRQRKRFRYLAECLNVTYVVKPAWIDRTPRHSTSDVGIPGKDIFRKMELIQVRLRPNKR